MKHTCATCANMAWLNTVELCAMNGKKGPVPAERICPHWRAPHRPCRKTGSGLECAIEMAYLLNEMLEADSVATSNLVNNRVPCSEAMVEHPHVPTADLGAGNLVGMLGVINGFISMVGGGVEIVAHYDSFDSTTNTGDVVRFSVRPVGQS